MIYICSFQKALKFILQFYASIVEGSWKAFSCGTQEERKDEISTVKSVHLSMKKPKKVIRTLPKPEKIHKSSDEREEKK